LGTTPSKCPATAPNSILGPERALQHRRQRQTRVGPATRIARAALGPYKYGHEHNATRFAFLAHPYDNGLLKSGPWKSTRPTPALPGALPDRRYAALSADQWRLVHFQPPAFRRHESVRGNVMADVLLTECMTSRRIVPNHWWTAATTATSQPATACTRTTGSMPIPRPFRPSARARCGSGGARGQQLNVSRHHR